MCSVGRQRAHRRDPALDEALALIAPCAGDEAEVVVGDQALAALVGERADRAVRHGLGVGRDRGSGDHGLEPSGHAAMKRGVAREVDRLDLAGAEDDVRVARVEALDLGEHPVVEAQLVNDRGLDLLGELGVQHLVGVGAEPRRGVDAAQEVGAALPAAVEELRLVDQRRAVAHRRRRSQRRPARAPRASTGRCRSRGRHGRRTRWLSRASCSASWRSPRSRTSSACGSSAGRGLARSPRTTPSRCCVRCAHARWLVRSVAARTRVPSARASISRRVAREAGLSDATESSRARFRQTGLIVALIPSAWSFSESWSATSPLTTS